MWLQTGSAPAAGSVNVGPFFCPELYINTGPYATAPANLSTANYNIEWIVYVEGRGQRMNPIV